VHDVDEVQELLESLSKISARGQAYYSSIDLRNMSGAMATDQDWHVKSVGSTPSTDMAAMSKSMSMNFIESKPSQAVNKIRNWQEGLLTIDDTINEDDIGEDDDDDGGIVF